MHVPVFTSSHCALCNAVETEYDKPHHLIVFACLSFSIGLNDFSTNDATDFRVNVDTRWHKLYDDVLGMMLE